MASQRPSVDEALALIHAAATRLGSERRPLAAALNHRLAEPVHARLSVPRFVASAMDGFALASAATEAARPDRPIELAIGSDASAGHWPSPLEPGTAVPISTGAPLPAGADTIVIREHARVVGKRLLVDAPLVRWNNVRATGEDVQAGTVLLPAGARVGVDAVGVLASAGIGEVPVVRRPRLLLFTTGNEIAATSAALADPALIPDSNGPMTVAFAATLGLSIDYAGPVTDDLPALVTMLARARDGDADIVLSTGGVSGGRFDLVAQALAEVGAGKGFHGVQMRPGKPLLFATLGSGRLYFGLPGTPVAALVALRFFVLAAIRAMAGLDPEAGQPIEDGPPARPGTTLFLRDAADGRQLDQRPHVLSSILRADRWLRVDDAGTRAYPKEPPSL
ncbi:molybdopterin molybdotransferase MoeA [Sphingosinicellaceae bacterium]|nr:molybdopterin molybdotransferase MoeA [Sphingosinicellaceae bacterium]